MSVIITGVIKNSIAEKNGIKPNDILISLNSNEINDVLDFGFYEKEKNLVVKLNSKTLTIKKGEYEELGLDFNTYLMDKQQKCKNKCIFCFIDQLPKGLRESLYFKDDDSRLSFLFGNYITLTNLTQKDVDRIIKMRISPINISVHTTNEELRCKMMNNKNAGKSLDFLYQLAEAEIKINCQLVLCNGINDGEELEKSLQNLSELYPSVQSVACVPLGVTKFREGLAQLTEYNKETATQVINIIKSFQEKMLEKNQTRLFYPADEFFIKAKMPIPEYDYYEDFSQIENGVGMLAMLKDEYEYKLENTDDFCKKQKISIVTGKAAYPFIKRLVDETIKKWHNLDCTVYAIENNFFGKSITVSGLIVGIDIIEQLGEKDLGDKVLIPCNMLRKEGDMFLDNTTVCELEEKLKIKIEIVQNSGEALLNALKN